MKIKFGFSILIVAAALFGGTVHAASSMMVNNLTLTGEGQPNPSYGKQVKSLMIFQLAGWTGYAYPPHKQTVPPYNFNHGFTWPSNGGVYAFVNRSASMYLTQMAQIKALSQHTAVAALIMPDSEGGMITCFNGQMSSTLGVCSSGQLMTTKQLLPHVKYAAWMKGVQVAPFFSITNLDLPANASDATKGAATLNKLKELTEWWINNHNDATSVKTTEGKLVILTESINSGLTPGSSQQLAVINYMNSKTNVLWIDNLANVDQNPSLAQDHILRSGATNDIATQDWLKNSLGWGQRYRYHHINRLASCTLYVNGCTRSISQTQYTGETQRLKTLNISPHESNGYPIVISQWNEYSEWLVYEPSQHDGTNEYNYLQWRLSQQP